MMLMLCLSRTGKMMNQRKMKELAKTIMKTMHSKKLGIWRKQTKGSNSQLLKSNEMTTTKMKTTNMTMKTSEASITTR